MARPERSHLGLSKVLLLIFALWPAAAFTQVAVVVNRAAS
jgi:hypothetical protein